VERLRHVEDERRIEARRVEEEREKLKIVEEKRRAE